MLCLEGKLRHILSWKSCLRHTNLLLVKESSPNLKRGEIKFADPSHKWPKPNQPVEIIVTRPINATRGCTGYLYDTEQNRMEHKAGCKVIGFAKQNNQYSYFIHHWDQIIQYEKLVFTCTWRNAVHGQGGLTSRIELEP